MSETIGVLNPGEMGSAVGAALRAAGHRVLWASAGRGPATAARAKADGLEDAGDVAAIARTAGTIVSVCPPHAALDLAREVAALRFRGAFIDGNAVSPATAREIGRLVEAGGATFVDGGIIGPPPRKPSTSRLYLSGTAAPRAAALFQGGLLEAIVVDGPPGAASAVKVAYAAWTKGHAALLMAVRAFVGGRHRVELAQGMAIRRRDGGDRGGLRRVRTTRGLPRGRRRGLQGSRRLEGHADAAVGGGDRQDACAVTVTRG